VDIFVTNSVFSAYNVPVFISYTTEHVDNPKQTIYIYMIYR